MAQNIDPYKGIKRLCQYWSRLAGVGNRWVALCAYDDENHISDDMNRVEECMLGLDAGQGEIMAKLRPCLIYGIASTYVRMTDAPGPYTDRWWANIVQEFYEDIKP